MWNQVVFMVGVAEITAGVLLLWDLALEELMANLRRRRIYVVKYLPKSEPSTSDKEPKNLDKSESST